MELGSNEAMPIFLCEPLQTPMVIPVFVDRADLARAWLASGRSRDSFDEKQHLTVMDLRMLVHQMSEEDRAEWFVIGTIRRPCDFALSSWAFFSDLVSDGIEWALLEIDPQTSHPEHEQSVELIQEMIPGKEFPEITNMLQLIMCRHCSGAS